jgi:cell division transport system ATP-binding protein
MLFFCYLKKCIFNIGDMWSEQQDKAPSATRRPLVSLRRVSRFYGTTRSALFDVSLDIAPGEFVYITGPSGAGKSTLLRMLGALETPDTGRVMFNGHDLASLKRSAISLLRRSMGIVFQDFRLVPELTVAANIALPLEVIGLSRDDIARRVDEVLERVGLEGRQRERAGELSGGEQQRIAIARAIVSRPELILADEPTGNLDAYNGDFVLDLLEQTAAGGATVVLATHDRMLMAARPHRTLALKNGRLMGMSSQSSDEKVHARPDNRLRSIG